MKNKLCILAGLAILVGLQFIVRMPFAEDIWEKSMTAGSTLKYALGWQPDNKELKSDDWESKGIKQYTLTHEQEVWTGALEWHESSGVKTAINPKDKDGTPSYYSFQWKPSTFKHYALRYKLLPNNLEDADFFNWMSDYRLQKEIVTRMIGERENINWKREFPHTVKYKIGFPPK